MAQDRLTHAHPVVLIGGSSGSIEVLLELLPALHPPLRSTVIIVVHRGNTADSTLTDLLAHRTQIPLREVDEKDPIEAGVIYLAPADYHVSRVVDHHKLGDLTTSAPAYLRFEPVGSTSTLLLKLWREAGLSVETQDARLMLSAILSDTLHFRSPTTTPDDRQAVEFLAPIAGVDDVGGFALAMFAAKSDLGDTPADTLLKMDYKVFPFGDPAQTWGIGVIETTNPAYVFGRQAELLTAMDQAKAQDGLSGVLLSVVDILNATNRTLVLSATEQKVLGEAFGVTAESQVADLGGRISRKKQIVPVLEEYFAPQV